MTAAAILQQAGFVPTVPTPLQTVGTPQSKAQGHVPTVPTVPTRNSEVETAHGNAGLEPGLTLTADQLAACQSMQADTANRHAGRVPPSDTAAIHCERCGPVWVHPTIAEVLPMVDGWPRALGCPWCFVRKTGGYIPRPPVTCEGCRYFTPDAINPPAGVGVCGAGKGMHYSMTRHACGTCRPATTKEVDHD